MGKFDNHMIFRIVLIVLAVFVLFVLINYYNSKQQSAKVERFYQDALQQAQQVKNSQQPFQTPLLAEQDQQNAQVSGRPQPAEEESNESYRTVDYSSQQKLPSDCFPKDRLTAEDLLPKDAANNKFSQVSPAGQGSLSDINLLSAGFNVGMNTVAGTLRNANLQIRSEPPNPQVAVSPWGQSTIAGDPWRKNLEIGSDC